MEIFDVLKQTFENSDENIFLCNDKLEILWKNHSELPDKLDFGKIRLYYNKEFTLPVKQSATAEYRQTYGETSALKIEPLKKDGEIFGYLVHMYTCEDVERISNRSGINKFKSNYLGNIRYEMSRVLNELDTRKNHHQYDNNLDYLRLDKQIRYRIQRTFAATTNYCELSRYYNPYFETRLINISTVLNDVCESVSELFENNGCMFRFDIDDGVYMQMNEERLKTALMNLLINAYSYNPKSEKMCELSLKTIDNKIVIKVSDNGNGIDEATISRSLKPFANFEDFCEKETLGIPVVNMFCKHFGGELTFETSEGNYTKAKMTFPISTAEESNDFHINRMPPMPNPYDPPTCVLAKAFDLSLF